MGVIVSELGSRSEGLGFESYPNTIWKCHARLIAGAT